MSPLAGEAELLLHGELDGQAVAVPAGLAGDVVALHRLEPGEHVLEDAGLDVVGAGHAVGGGRALVERPGAAGRGCVERPLEDLFPRQNVEHLVLERGKVDLGVHQVCRLVVLLGLTFAFTSSTTRPGPRRVMSGEATRGGPLSGRSAVRAPGVVK